ncbi:hypothetical protein LCGC14_2569850 [marine sediment metagenome]|uniref:RNA ligase domain-containing protein n=1 Tax=marine sediment metagenome TaxID=412755 RepID=A0A0F9CTK8_9ZZZZ
MKEYHKIQTVFKRDPATNHRTLLLGNYSLPEFDYLQKNQWVFTEKVDGTNIRVMFQDGDRAVSFGGKTDNAQISAKLVSRLRELFTASRLAEVFDGDACLYGEGYGKGIQNGGFYRPTQEFVLFDVKVGDWWLQRKDVEDVAAKLSLDVVPVLGTGTLRHLVDAVRGGCASTWGNFPAEGIVARPATELCTRGGERLITKLKAKDFA